MVDSKSRAISASSSRYLNTTSYIGLAIIMGIYFNSRQDRLFMHHLGRQKTKNSDVLENMGKALKYIGGICAARG
jgi:hypothetical protein